ncbi:GC-rich sequence DNA-binding factor 2 [Neoarius graeffei]|uniref:GC-rich sequence DNA-binding factor 2 n=1 Tax=Neoarius graeffei TaxID=443677 RepID=UPI00298CF44D|nr:GC-rich sequence DNA-binding factor 2 [Neoarius graeffei]XP_060789992.1 GC-rich sequence DNA-binding factor 2 [Neoarius graeffei]
MFNRKVRRNFRQRRDESSEEDEGEKVSDGVKEVDASVPSVKEVNVRRGISCSSKPNSTPPHRGTGSSPEPTQDPETSKPHTKGKKTPKSQILSFLDEKGVGESDFKLKRTVDKAVVFQARKKEDSPFRVIPSQQDVEDNELKEQSESSSVEDMCPDSNDETNSTASSSSSSTDSFRTQTVNIPNAEKIRAAKEQRRRARAQREYIPLDADQQSETEVGDRSQDQSDRERCSDDEPDDHECRIQFAPKSKTLREQMTEKMGGSGSKESCSDSQEEDQHLWEEQQIGKGVKRHQKQSRNDFKPLRQKKKVAIPETLSPVSIDIVKKRITGTLESLKEVQRAHEAELRRMQQDIESARSSVENLENHRADSQILFYRSMSTFTQNLVECLSEKMQLINSVEMDMHNLYIDQAEALLSQRRKAVQEQSRHLQELTYSTNPNSNGEALGKTSTLEDCELLKEDCGSVPADLGPTAEQEAELQSKRKDILKRSQEIFTDVQDDFSDVKKILSRFDEWRVSFPESYTNAYISLCLSKLLAPLIRHQLIGWNPLKAEGEDFEALPWYSAVEKFCHGQGYEESETVDEKTLPAIIEKAILPKIQGFVELVWDPLSLHQSECLTSLCKRIQEDYCVFDGEQSKPVKAFLKAVIQRLRSAVDDDVFIPLYPKLYLDDKTSPQFQFQNRQFWSAVKLLGNMALWDGLIAQDILKELMLDKLLNRYLMMTLLNESDVKHIIQKSKKVTECFPKSWFVDPSTGSSLSQLQHFRKHLLQTADLLCKDRKDPNSCRTGLSDVMILLWTIKASESMKIIAEKHNCHDLLESIKSS